MDRAAEPAADTPDAGISLVGVVDRVIFGRPETGWRVIRVNVAGEVQPVVVVGTLPDADTGEILRAEGSWYFDRIWGRQPPGRGGDSGAARDRGRPDRLSEVRKDQRARRGRSASPRQALRHAPRRRHPERAPAAVRSAGMAKKLQERICTAWGEQGRMRDAVVFLAGKGLSAGRAGRVLQAYGEKAIERVSADPYAMVRDVRGIGFTIADEVAGRLGIAPNSPQRIAAGLAEVLRVAAMDGDTALPHEAVAERTAELLSVPLSEALAAVATEVQARHLTAVAVADRQWLMLPSLAKAESAIAQALRDRVEGPPPWGDDDVDAALERSEAALGFPLAGAQREAIAEALRRRLLIVTGGPGTGKTTLVRGILAALAPQALKVELAAPTGRAARRLGESTGAEARTLHRLLEAQPDRAFRRNAGRPVDCDLLIVDEASMIDTPLMAGLLDALPPAAALLVVGDVDQLPSIGPGQVLADLIDSGVLPVLRLTEIFRQATESTIVANAHRINHGELPEFGRTAGGLTDFYGIRVEGPEDGAAKLLDLVTSRIPERFGFNAMTDVQVLTPVNRGPLGTRALNELLQRHLNPSPAASLERGGQRFGVGDKVMQLENDYEREVYNGDVGLVTAVDPRAGSLQVTIDGRDLQVAGDDLDRLSLAYATTVHKAQGSEYAAIVMPLVRHHGRMLRRDLLYTAITRAKHLVVLLTEPESLERAVTAGGRARHTLLRQRLQQPELFA